MEHMDVAAEFQFMFSGLDFTGPNGTDLLDIGDLVPGNRIMSTCTLRTGASWRTRACRRR